MGLVKIEECDNSNIEQVKLKNNSISPLILLDGEEIAGSLQNRIVAQTMIIPPKSEMEIPVNCSEKGRNEYKSEFQYSDYIANSNTRRKKAYHKNNPFQEVVWNSIDDLETDKNTSSKTKALRDSYEKNKYVLIYKNNMVHASFFKKIEEPAVNNGFVKNIQNNKQAIC